MAKKGESLNISPEKIIVKKLRDIFYELSNLDAEVSCLCAKSKKKVYADICFYCEGIEGFTHVISQVAESDLLANSIFKSRRKNGPSKPF